MTEAYDGRQVVVIDLHQARTSVKDQVHAVLAKLGIPVTCSDLFGPVRRARAGGWRS